MLRTLFIGLIFIPFLAFSQQDTLDLPEIRDSTKILIFNVNVRAEATRAMADMYNFKFSSAEKEFIKLRNRYPRHPLPYFLMGLSQWWKIQPNQETETYDAKLLAYMDTVIAAADVIYKEEKNNPEGPFFLAAGYAFKSRNYADRGKWLKAAVTGKKTLHYIDESKKFIELSPELLFGEAMFNYYSEWAREEYPILKPLMSFTRRGNKKLGLQQMKEAALNAFYVRTEAQTFLMKIYADYEKDLNPALEFARYLATSSPDNAYFQRYHAQLAWQTRNWNEAEEVCLNMMEKIDMYTIGYENTAGRYASYYLGYIYFNVRNDLSKAKIYFKKALEFSDNIDAYDKNYYLYSLSSLAKIALKENNKKEAEQYYNTILEKADKKHAVYKEAKAFNK